MEKSDIQPHLLIVRPEHSFEPVSDNYLRLLTFDLLGEAFPSVAETAVNIVHPGVSSLEEWPVRPGLLGGIERRRRAAILSRLDFAMDLLRALLQRDITAVLPSALLVSASDSRLDTWTVVGGQFLQNVLYAAHPKVLNTYLPLAGFHQYLIDEKRAEFVRIAAALGARSIEIVTRGEESTNAAAGLKAQTPLKSGTVGAGGGASISHGVTSNFDLSATFPRPKRAPTVPDDLRWLPSEPYWRAMVDARLKDDVGSFRVAFGYADDFSVNAELATFAVGCGISLGGSFCSMTSTSQTYEVLFHPHSAYEGRI